MAEKRHIDFLGLRKIFFTISGFLTVAILICAFVMGVKLDIQFKGGTLISYSYSGDLSSNDIQTAIKNSMDMDVSVTLKTGLNGTANFEIVSLGNQGITAEKLNELTTNLESTFSANNLEFLSNSSVDPVMGKEFFAKSMVAVAFATVVLIVYIALRFKKISGWSAGVMAIVALLNDLIIVFGVFVIFRLPLDYNFIAVLLTILGYSVNDTIVIYDRIRENNRRYGKTMDRHTLVNNSINETLTRTINTSVSTLIAMLCVMVVAFVMNVGSIVTFALPMAVGLISGTYTTIFLAGPLWVTWQDHKDKAKAKAKLKASRTNG